MKSKQFADNDSPYVTSVIPAQEGKCGGTCDIQMINSPNYFDYFAEAVCQFNAGRIMTHLTLKSL